MDATRCAVTLAARGHARDGRQLSDPGTVDRLRAAATALGANAPGVLTGPSVVTEDGLLLLSLAAPEAALAAVLGIATAMRPTRTTFCAVAVAAETGGQASATPAVDGALIAAGAAADRASSSILDTDPRECRVLVFLPHEEPQTGALIDLVLERYDSMTDRQRQIVALIRNSDTQQEVATHLDISRQAVNQSLAASGWLHVRRAEGVVRSRLADAGERLTVESPDPAVVRTTVA